MWDRGRQRMRRVLTGLICAVILAGLGGCAPQRATPAQKPVPTAQQRPSVPPRPAADAMVRVGMLVPLSGPQAALGQGLLEAAQLALYESGADDVALIPQDTGGTKEQALVAAHAALADGARLLIGPVFSPELEAIRPVAAARQVPVLALSNNAQLAGGGSFILGFTPGEQVARVLAFAKGRGVVRVGALVPRSAYGDAVVDALTENVLHNGMTLVRLERYEPGADPAMTAQAFVAALNASGGADAVLLPEGGDALRALAGNLVAAGLALPRTRLVGTALWEGVAGQVPALAGGWYAGFNPAQRRAFTARYAAAYGHAPSGIASLAYDATALAATLARSGPDIDPGARLTSAQGFSGVDGIFRLRPTGDVERGLAVFEITPSGVTVADPAPDAFTP